MKQQAKEIEVTEAVKKSGLLEWIYNGVLHGLAIIGLITLVVMGYACATGKISADTESGKHYEIGSKAGKSAADSGKVE